MAGQKDLLNSFENTNEPAPHVQFANCMTDEDLIAFVERFGPINGFHAETRVADVEPENFLKMMERVDSYSPDLEGWWRRFAEESRQHSLAPSKFRGVIQNLKELRTERDVFRAALELTDLLLETAPERDHGETQEFVFNSATERVARTGSGRASEVKCRENLVAPDGEQMSLNV